MSSNEKVQHEEKFKAIIAIDFGTDGCGKSNSHLPFSTCIHRRKTNNKRSGIFNRRRQSNIHRTKHLVQSRRYRSLSPRKETSQSQNKNSNTSQSTKQTCRIWDFRMSNVQSLPPPSPLFSASVTPFFLMYTTDIITSNMSYLSIPRGVQQGMYWLKGSKCYCTVCKCTLALFCRCTFASCVPAKSAAQFFCACFPRRQSNPFDPRYFGE